MRGRGLAVLALAAATLACGPGSSPASPTSSPPAAATFTPVSTALPAPSADVVLVVDPERPTVGETVAVTVTLRNTSDVMLGLPLYRLGIEQPADAPVLEPAAPGPVEHHLGLGRGESDTALFSLRVVRPGRAALDATVGVEVHWDYPGPASWMTFGSEEVVVEVIAP